MTWVDVEKAAKSAEKHASAAVVVSVSRPGKSAQRFILSVRTRLLDGGLPFWTIGANVRVQIGSGEDAGKLRITPVGPFVLNAQGRKDNDLGTIAVQFPLPAGMPLVQQLKRAVEYDSNDDWLEITLPSWAKSSPPITTARSAAAAAAPTKGQVFRTVATVGSGPRPSAGGR